MYMYMCVYIYIYIASIGHGSIIRPHGSIIRPGGPPPAVRQGEGPCYYYYSYD